MNEYNSWWILYMQNLCTRSFNFYLTPMCILKKLSKYFEHELKSFDILNIMFYLTQCYTFYTSSRGHIIRIKTRTIFKIIETYGILLYLIGTQIAILSIQDCTNSW